MPKARATRKIDLAKPQQADCHLFGARVNKYRWNLGVEMTSANEKKYKLDPAKTIPYFSQHIQCGKMLSKKVVEKIDFTKGCFFTILPAHVQLDKIYEFEQGGIIPPIPYQKGDANFPGKQVITMDTKCSQWIFSFLQKGEKNLCIIENTMLTPDSLHVHIENVKAVSYEEDVYYLLDNKNSVEEIYMAIRKSSQVWHFLSVLFSSTLPLPASSLTMRSLGQICADAQFLIAGAYDGESYIFWEKVYY